MKKSVRDLVRETRPLQGDALVSLARGVLEGFAKGVEEGFAEARDEARDYDKRIAGLKANLDSVVLINAELSERLARAEENLDVERRLRKGSNLRADHEQKRLSNLCQDLRNVLYLNGEDSAGELWQEVQKLIDLYDVTHSRNQEAPDATEVPKEEK